MNSSRTLHQILLQPTDVLFFRDGRPMGGSLAGHTAAWPLPDVTSHAIHAALHRAGFTDVHGHDHRDRNGGSVRDIRKFGSLLTAGPFPVRVDTPNANTRVEPTLVWYFPRPKDAQQKGSVAVTLHPAEGGWRKTSSLPEPLLYAVANTQPPTKDTDGEPWLSSAAYECYLHDRSDPTDPADLVYDSIMADTEYAIGIAIDPVTQTTGRGEAEGQIYAAHYLRLREGWCLGMFAECLDKISGDPQAKRDLIVALLNNKPQTIIVGGQQRLCTAKREPAPVPLPLPRGLSKPTDFNKLNNGKYAVKWILLTPAVWPEIQGDSAVPHPGGWLPNWIAEKKQEFEGETVSAGSVLLLDGPGKEKAKRKRLTPGRRIRARLVAAIVPKPIPVTGWALPNELDRPLGGAKSTHLAVPAGAVYYFEAETAEDAAKLAAALNWHGSLGDSSDQSDHSNLATIKNRRSTLLGEKGYGLGVCGTWSFWEDVVKRPGT